MISKNQGVARDILLALNQKSRESADGMTPLVSLRQLLDEAARGGYGVRAYYSAGSRT